MTEAEPTPARRAELRVLLEKATTVAGFPTEEQIYIVLKCYDRNEAVYADDDGNGSWLDAYDRHHWAPLIEQAV